MNKTVAVLPNLYMANLGQDYEVDLCVHHEIYLNVATIRMLPYKTDDVNIKDKWG